LGYDVLRDDHHVLRAAVHLEHVPREVDGYPASAAGLQPIPPRLLQARKESVWQGAALGDMRRRLDLLRARVDELAVGTRMATEGIEQQGNRERASTTLQFL
jgi:hypothetical protein